MVKSDAIPVDPANAFWQNARPGKRKTEYGKTQRLGQENVVFIAMIKVTGDSGTTPALDLALPAREGIPDGWRLPIAVPGSFILHDSHIHAPSKIIAEFPGYEFIRTF